MPDEVHARIAQLETALRIVRNEVLENRQTIAAHDKRIRAVEDEARAATRAAQNSVHELEGIADGMIRAIKQSEEARAQGAAAHAKRFEEQGAAIKRQGEMIVGLQAATTKRGQLSTILWAAGVFLIPALTPLAQALYPQGLLPAAPPATVEVVRPPARDAGASK